jgi:hypothetical protein
MVVAADRGRRRQTGRGFPGRSAASETAARGGSDFRRSPVLLGVRMDVRPRLGGSGSRADADLQRNSEPLEPITPIPWAAPRRRVSGGTGRPASRATPR